MSGGCVLSSPALPSVAVAHLLGDQRVVEALLGQQLLVCALFHHHAGLEHHDAVGVLDGGQPVGHHDAGPALAGLVQGLLDHLGGGQGTRTQ